MQRLMNQLIWILGTLGLTVVATAGGQTGFGIPGLENPLLSEPERAHVEVSVITDRAAVIPGSELAIAVVFDMADKWHIWPNRVEFSEEAVKVLGSGFEPHLTDVTLPDELPAWIEKADDRIVQWPEPHLVLTGSVSAEPIEVPLWEGRVAVYIPVIVASDAPTGPASLEIGYYYQACDDTNCDQPVSGSATLNFEIVSIEAASTVEDEQADLRRETFADFDAAVAFQDLREGNITVEAVKFNVFGLQFEVDPTGFAGIALLVVLAFFGGMLLNLTPCVLPVIPIKILGLSAAAGNPARCFMLGLVMSLGVVAFWMAIGLSILFISGFDAISTLFQQPWFPIAVGVFIGAMGLGMLGLFAVRLPQAVYMINPSHESIHGSFLFGIMTAVLSTPCTAPFMGTAAAWAAENQNPFFVLLTFGAIGTGMALPYLVLSANPKWVDRMPRTGPASELIKQTMGLLMFAVAAFFLGVGLAAVLQKPGQPPSQVHWWIVGVLAVAASLWVIVQTWKITKKPVRRMVVTFGALFFAAFSAAAVLRVTDPGPIDWVYYTPERYAEAEAKGDVIVLDFTAEWCLNCKTLEKISLHPERVAELLNSEGVTPMKADLTTKRAPGWERLLAEGSRTIPLLVIRGPGLDEPWRSEAYTSDQVIEAVREARGGAAMASGEG